MLEERQIEYGKYSIEKLHKVGMDNVKENIEFYFNKTYTCESVIKELFIRGIIEYINRNKFTY